VDVVTVSGALSAHRHSRGRCDALNLDYAATQSPRARPP
jgi:hypothetical protein